MKKRIVLLLTTLLIPLICFSKVFNDNTILNLHTDESYIVSLDYRPLNLEISNSNIAKVESITDIFSTKTELLITTKNEGISYITFELNKQPKTIKLIINNHSQEDDFLFKLDKPMVITNKK